MKKNDLKTLHEKTITELQAQLVELRQQLAEAKLKLKVGKLDDIKQPSKLRDDISRLLTIMSQKNLLTAVMPVMEKEVKTVKKAKKA